MHSPLASTSGRGAAATCSNSCAPRAAGVCLPRRRGALVRAKAFAPGSESLLVTARLASQLLSTGLMAVGAYMLTRQLQVEQDLNQTRGGEACPRCGGSGREPCMCTRWSDGDRSGCSTCSHSGYMPCRSCGGGGMAVPLLRRAEKLPPRQ